MAQELVLARKLLLSSAQLFLLNLLGWHWLIKVYKFQVYSSIIHHQYTVLCVHHPKLGLLPSPFIPHFILFCFLPPPFPLVITILLSVSMRFYFFCFNPFTFFTQFPNPPPLWQLSICSLYLWVCFYFLSLFCLLDSIYKWNHMVLVFHWLAYFIYHNTIQVHPWLSQKVRFPSFLRLL